MTTYVFPGQGIQEKGMGKNLFDKFSKLTLMADRILGYSIKKLCLEAADEQLNNTQYTQPAIYIVNALNYLNLVEENRIKPNFVAGHSLGEYNALLAANVFDFEVGLRLVQKRAELMSQARNGSMVAIIGLDENQITSILKSNNLKKITIANYNSYSQFVLSGEKKELCQIIPIFEQAGAIKITSLTVSGAFHSPFMETAQKKFERIVESFQFSPPTIPVISNLTARPYQAAEIQKNLIQQISMPVRWTETIEYLLLQNETNFEEVGQGTILTGLIHRIKNGQ